MGGKDTREEINTQVIQSGNASVELIRNLFIKTITYNSGSRPLK